MTNSKLAYQAEVWGDTQMGVSIYSPWINPEMLNRLCAEDRTNQA